MYIEERLETSPIKSKQIGQGLKASSNTRETKRAKGKKTRKPKQLDITPSLIQNTFN